MSKQTSVYQELGFQKTIAESIEMMCELYLSDSIPWVVGYSGGKDSTAILQLVWMALRQIPAESRTKPVHVISTDTLVENPVVAAWVTHSLDQMNQFAAKEGLPLKAHRLTPTVQDSFWVNLIGRGYPAPRHKFRWCTERLKIKPSNQFISTLVRQNGEAILVLGTRKAESATRARTMAKHEARRTRDMLSPNASLPNSLVFTPVEAWTNDDVWLFLMQVPNPWGYDNKDLLNMYQGASEDGECPLVVDTSTPSCGDSRFGCWVCTLVEKDKSMAAMIQNDVEKEWMLPLLELRDALDVHDDRHLRDFRRMNGNVMAYKGRLIHGPYLQSSREDWLRWLLEAQTWVRENGPSYVRSLELITPDELDEIRRLWVVEKCEIEDRVPIIWREATKTAWPGRSLDDCQPFSEADMQLLRELCGDDRLLYEGTRNLLVTEWSQRTALRRSGLLQELEKELKKTSWKSEEDALAYRLRRRPEEDGAPMATDGSAADIADEEAHYDV
jgi:DNA sulfur modification protein DndC